MNTGDEPEEDDAEQDSGPYCPHWSEPGDCDECRAPCATCGHEWVEHEMKHGAEPEAGECNACDGCKVFVPKPEGA